MKTNFLTLTLLTLAPFTLFADETFIPANTLINESFIKVMAKNRANKRVTSSNYTEINSKEDFLEALDDGDINNNNIQDSNNLISEYHYTEIKNTNINQDDLRNVEGDTLRLGSTVKRGKVTQIIKIKNSQIQTDKALDLAVNLDANEINSATSFTQIQGSTLRGGSSRDRRDKSFSDISFEEDNDDGLLSLDRPSR